MLDVTMSKRPNDLQILRIILKKYEEMTEVEKEILENAVMEIYSMFDMDPNKYQFDFRFNRK
jgi:hypothetical protein